MGQSTRRALPGRAVPPATLAACCLLLASVSAVPAAAVSLPAPLLQMVEPALRLPPVEGSNSSSGNRDSSAGGSSSDVFVGVRLVGAAQRPVSAQLAVLLPALADSKPPNSGSAVPPGWSLADPAQLWLEPSLLRWAAGEVGTKWVRLRSAAELPLALALVPAALEGTNSSSSGAVSVSTASVLRRGDGQAVLQVNLAGASGAAIADAPLNSTEVVLGEHSGDNMPLFGFIANQVAYPPASSKGSSSGHSNGASRIPVRLLAGRLDGPATLRFTLRLLPSPLGQQPAQFLPAKAMHGFLLFKPQSEAAPTDSGANSSSSSSSSGTEQHIVLPLAWSSIPPDAEYRLAMELEGVYGARVAPQPDAVALHIFGTPVGSCPPGSALRAPGNGSAAAPLMPRDSNEYGPMEPPVGGNGSAGFLLSPNGTAIHLSSTFLPDVQDYGAMVEADVSEVTLCMRLNTFSGSQAGPGFVVSLQPAGKQGTAEELEPASEDVAEEACGCGEDEEDAGDGDGGCEYTAWVLPLLPGQNVFNITLKQPAEGEDSPPSANEGAANEQHASLAVVRLAEPDHAWLESITVRASDGQAVLLCGPSSAGTAQPYNRAVLGVAPGDAAGMVLPRLPPICRPDRLLSLNVSDAARMVSLTPALKHPDVPGIRVEVNGQVLSRGGDVQADQLQDTTAAVDTQQRSNTTFLPSAFIMGLQPGGKLDVQVVVVAEDGVTTSRFPIQFVLGESEQGFTIAEASTNSSAAPTAPAADVHRSGWPLSPAQQSTCTVCQAGWAATSVNSSHCVMCPPGTFAPWPQSTSCQPCSPGSFAYSWGSAYCKNCIEGTYAPKERSPLCLPCPEGTSTVDDGSSTCVPTKPGAYQAPRYAVVVSFYVELSGLELEDVVVRAGVAGDPEAIISSLLRADTALAFNISQSDVQVVAMRRVARRTLSANVTAMLGVEVPVGATEEEIEAALEVQRLSADEPIEMLSSDPDRFFGRTTEALEVQVESGVPATLSTMQGPSRAGLIWAMLAPGIVAIVAGSGLVTVGCRRSKACARWRASASRQLATTRLVPASQRYSRYGRAGGTSNGGSDRHIPAGGNGAGISREEGLP